MCIKFQVCIFFGCAQKAPYRHTDQQTHNIFTSENRNILDQPLASREFWHEKWSIWYWQSYRGSRGTHKLKGWGRDLYFSSNLYVPFTKPSFIDLYHLLGRTINSRVLLHRPVLVLYTNQYKACRGIWFYSGLSNICSLYYVCMSVYLGRTDHSFCNKVFIILLHPFFQKVCCFL